MDKLPKRWNNYTKIGNIISGTRIIPLKTPLREEICERSLVGRDWFTPEMLLEEVPDIKLIIDLTQTDRFYRRQDFVRNGVIHEKIVCPGGGKQLPKLKIVRRFIGIIDNFMKTVGASDERALIGVHCTHGLNRTGYLICKYMVENCGWTPSEAIMAFEDARGHKMERKLYVQDIKRSVISHGPSNIETDQASNDFEDNRHSSKRQRNNTYLFTSERGHAANSSQHSNSSNRGYADRGRPYNNRGSTNENWRDRTDTDEYSGRSKSDRFRHFNNKRQVDRREQWSKPSSHIRFSD